MTIEGVVRNLDPELDMLEVARPYLIKTISKKLNPLHVGKRMLNGLFEYSMVCTE